MNAVGLQSHFNILKVKTALKLTAGYRQTGRHRLTGPQSAYRRSRLRLNIRCMGQTTKTGQK